MSVLSIFAPSVSAALPAAPAPQALSFDGVVANLPHDPASIFVLVLLVAAVIGLWRASRGERPGGPGPQA